LISAILGWVFLPPFSLEVPGVKALVVSAGTGLVGLTFT